MKFFGLLFASFTAAAFTLPEVLQGTWLPREAVEQMFDRAYDKIGGSISRNGLIEFTVEEKAQKRFRKGQLSSMKRLFPNGVEGAPAEAVESEMATFFTEFETFLELIESSEVVLIAAGLSTEMIEASLAIFLVRRRLGRTRSKTVVRLRIENLVLTRVEERFVKNYKACIGSNPTPAKIQSCKA